MPRIYLVRHGRAAAGWDVDPDPDLDDLGRAQAVAVADRLGALSPMPVLSSPLARCRRTAAPLAERWGVAVAVDPAVAEIPSPQGVAIGERVTWLRAAMAGTWADLGERYTAYRGHVVAALAATTTDTVVFSHFVAINAAIGACLGRDELVLRSLDNGSVTVIDADPASGGRLVLVESGHEADTLIR